MPLIGLLALTLALLVTPVRAEECDVSASFIDFGQVVRSDGDLVRGEVRVLCARPTRFELSLSEGDGDYRRRKMRGPDGRRLAYNVYLDPSLQRVWGDGLTAGTGRLSGRNDGRRATILPVYARLEPGQGPVAGHYSDSLLVMVDP
ncbi:MAG: spore coat U domain-containing protein [Geminicoccaceae bacterium]|nr:spore coat U domain-containing protein [Geminicoccaceae bacterium]